MTPYEELIEQMRKAGRFYNPQVPEFGIMGHDGRVKIGSGIINKCWKESYRWTRL